MIFFRGFSIIEQSLGISAASLLLRNQVKPQKDLKGFQCIFSSMNSHTWECHTVFQGKILIYWVTQQFPPYFEYIILDTQKLFVHPVDDLQSKDLHTEDALQLF